MKRTLGGLMVCLLLWAALLPGCKKSSGADGVDLTTPRAAAGTFCRALVRGDAAGARAAAIVSTDEEGRWVDAMAAVTGGMNRAREASARKFGAEAAKTFGENDPGQMFERAVNDSKETIDRGGATARLVTRNDKEPILLKKVGGEWKLDVSALVSDEKMTEALPKLTALGQAAYAVSDEIDAGKYKDVDQAMHALGTRLMAIVLSTTRPSLELENAAPEAKVGTGVIPAAATRPSTRPATQPAR